MQNYPISFPIFCDNDSYFQILLSFYTKKEKSQRIFRFLHGLFYFSRLSEYKYLTIWSRTHSPYVIHTRSGLFYFMLSMEKETVVPSPGLLWICKPCPYNRVNRLCVLNSPIPRLSLSAGLSSLLSCSLLMPIPLSATKKWRAEALCSIRICSVPPFD
jgi:hypothetical protein